MAQNVMETEAALRKEDINTDLMQEEDVEEDDVILQLEDKSRSDNQNRFWRLLEPRVGWRAEESDQFSHNIKFDSDPYDTFMRRHLQHYGYFTGRNASFRNDFDGLESWHRNYDLRLSGTQNLSVDDDQLRKMGHYQSHKNNQLDPGLVFAEGQPPDELLSRTTQLVFHYQAGKKIPKLREPRNLYALTKEPGPQQATRWPSHMQVVSSPVHFIDYTPTVPDPFYIPSGKEATPAVRGTPSGEIVYLNDPGRDVYFMRSRVAGCRLAMRDISLTPRETVDQGNYTLEFESRFESGNLLKAVKINDFDYELTLRPDLYTEKHTQWYFFRVRNMVPGKTYRITIVNLMKPSSLYNNGMKPLFYSEIEAKKNKIGWTRAGSDIRYYRNNLGSMSGRTYYSLTWTIEFPHKDDACFFAHCYPYTYTDLQEYLLKLANDPVRSRFCKQRVLCRTLAGNLVYVLTVTSPSRNPEIARTKKAVVLTARVHPGETNASWMMKGFLDFLSGNSADAKLLRDNFIFKIVPMLNPDGVIVGNYRCSLAGRDLNRNYKSVLKDSFPSVWHTKMMIKRLNMEREVILYCDLHGHSRKNNIFIYGCENKNNPQRKLKERVFPLMLSKNADTKFSFESCKFKVQKSKEGTGRVVMWYMGIMNSYTMEATFGGTTLGSRKGTHFSTKDLEEMGHNFCDTLLDYCDPDISKAEACYQEIQDRLRRQILKKMQLRNGIGSLGDVNIDDYSSDYESDTSGSDSSCDDGLPVHLLAIAPKLQRKRRLKTRRDRNKQATRKSSAPVQEDSKPTPSHGAKPVPEKQPKPIRYSHTAGNKKRDEHNPTVSVGTTANATVFQSEENNRPAKKTQRPAPWKTGTHDPDKRPIFYFCAPSHSVALNSKPPLPQESLSKRELSFTLTKRRSDYLEALTTAYIRSGVLMVPDKKKAVSDYSMRYTNGVGKNKDSNMNVQYLASQFCDLTAESGSENDAGPLMRNAACQWSPQPELFSNIDSDCKSIDDATREAVLAEEQYELLRRSALRRQLSPAQQRVLAQRHLAAVAQMQQKREQASSSHRPVISATEIRHGSGTPLKQHPNPFEADATSPSRGNSRCASATRKQDSARKTQVVQQTNRPDSFESHIRANPEGTVATYNQGSVSATDSTGSLKKNTTIPPSTKTTVEDEKLIDEKQAQEIITAIASRTINLQSAKNSLESSESSVNSSNLSSASIPMHTPNDTDKDQPIEPSLKNCDKEKNSKGKSILLFGSPDNTMSNRKTPENTRISEEFIPPKQSGFNNESVSITSNADGKEALTSMSTSHQVAAKVTKTNPVFGEALDPLPEKESSGSLNPGRVIESSSPQQRLRAKPSSQASILTDDPLGSNEVSLEKIPQQWGGKKQLVILDVHEESSPEPIKRDRPRVATPLRIAFPPDKGVKLWQLVNKFSFDWEKKWIRVLSGKKGPLSNVIAEGHSNRFRAKTFHGNGENETYFGMSDNVGPANLKHGERVPPVVANIAELRRTLMGQSRNGKEEEPNIRGTPPPNLARQKSQPATEEEKNSQVIKRRSVNLRPRAHPRIQDSLLEENEEVELENGVENLKSESAPDIPLVSSSKEPIHNSEPPSPRVQERNALRHRDRQKRRHVPPTLRNTEHAVNRIHHSSGEVEDVVEEKWPTLSENDIRRYSQGNATIEKFNDHSLTSIRFGSRTSEHSKRLREQWIDVHQRQVVSTVTPRQDMLAMSSVSLNIAGEIDEKNCVTTPALAKRPVPPLLRYLSAKQTTKKKW